MGYDDMSYKKCANCRWCKEYQYLGEIGVVMRCEITGKGMQLNHCKKYYGDE